MGSEAKKNFLSGENQQKPQNWLNHLQFQTYHLGVPWGYPGGIRKAKNHLELVFGSRLEALTRKSQNLVFQRGQFGCLAPSGAVKIL